MSNELHRRVSNDTKRSCVSALDGLCESVYRPGILCLYQNERYCLYGRACGTCLSVVMKSEHPHVIGMMDGGVTMTFSSCIMHALCNEESC